MNYLTRLSDIRRDNLEKAQSMEKGLPPTQSYIGGLYYPNSYDLYSARAYERSAWVATALRTVMNTTGMAVPLVKILRDKKYIEDIAHPMKRLLNYPNFAAKLSRFWLFAETFARLHMEGNCFWFLKGNRQPSSIQIVPSRYIRLEQGEELGTVKEYVYMPSDKAEVRIDPVQIIHFKKYHPNLDLWGLSTLSAAMIEIAGDYNMAMWNQNFFGPQNAIPAMAVEFSGQMSDQEFVRSRLDWTKTGGMARETKFFRSGAGFNKTTIHDIGLTPLEISFIEGRKLNRKTIFDLFGVSESMYDKDATEATSITGERRHYQNVFEELNLLSQQLTLELAPFYSSEIGDVIVEIQDIRPINKELELREIQAAEKHLSINEVRAKYYDADEVVWGDGPAAGSGAARLMFSASLQQEMQADEQKPGYQQNFNEGRDRANNPPPGEEKPKEQERTPQTRGYDRQDVARAQKKALWALGKGLSLTDLDFPNLPLKVQAKLKANLAMCETHDDILRTFDPLFAAPQSSDILVEKQAQHWIDRQLEKLPAEVRASVEESADELIAAFNFDEKADALMDIPDDIWNSLASEPPATL